MQSLIWKFLFAGLKTFNPWSDTTLFIYPQWDPSAVNVTTQNPNSAVEEVQSVPADPAGSLQDFFNDSSSADRPIIDAP